MLKAATARGLGPCGPRQLGSGTPPHPQLRSGHRHQAPAAAPPPSPLPGVHPALHPRSTVTTNSSPVRGTHGGSCSSGPQSRAPAQPIGGHLSRFSLLGMHGQMNSPPTTLFGRSAQLQTRAAKGDAATGATSPSGGDENDSLSALFKRFRNNLDAPIALEKEYEGSTTVGGKGDVEGRIVKKVVELEKRILERMREQEQRLAAVAEAQGQRTKEEVKKLVEAEVALLLPQIAILLRQELDATYTLAPPPQQEQEAKAKGKGKVGSASEALSAVGRALASAWADPWVANLREEWLRYLGVVLTCVYYVVVTVLGLILCVWLLYWMGLDLRELK